MSLMSFHQILVCLVAAATAYSGPAAYPGQQHTWGRQPGVNVDQSSNRFTLIGSVTSLMTRLLHAQPLLPKTSKARLHDGDKAKQVPAPQPASDQTTGSQTARSCQGSSRLRTVVTEGDPVVSHAANHDAAGNPPQHLVTSFGTAPSWPTPNAVVWTDIQMIATRASVMLESITPEAQLVAGCYTACKDEQHLDLRQALIVLLHDLLGGHVLDPQLDMRPVFTFALVPLMREWVSWQTELAPLNILCSALLMRLAVDKPVVLSQQPQSKDQRAWDRKVTVVSNMVVLYCKPQSSVRIHVS